MVGRPVARALAVRNAVHHLGAFWRLGGGGCGGLGVEWGLGPPGAWGPLAFGRDHLRLGGRLLADV